ERYAMIKARALCGRPQDIAVLEGMLRPFIYRRYLDYGAIESLRDLKATMVAEMKRRGLSSCVKLGVGGIREVEFIGQSFQLVRGGREQPLQQRGILAVLACLGELELLSAEESTFLPEAYDFLRRLENRLQMLADQQTHALPVDELGEQRMAYAMGYASWSALLADMQPLRERVHAVFRDVFSLEEAETVERGGETPLASAWGELEVDSIAPLLAAAGFAHSQATAAWLHELRHGGFYSRNSSKGQERLDKLMPMLLMASSETRLPDETLERLVGIIRTIAGRSVYLQVLLDNPPALQLLVRLCEASGPVAEFIAKHPLVLDELLHGVAVSELPDRAQVESQARAQLAHVDFDDLEQQMERMRQFRHGVAMRVAVADVLGELPVMRVSDCLSWLAEAVLTVSLEVVWRQLVAKHGEPRCLVDGEEYKPSIAIVAYGKLGGLELSYTSDLDIVFLHDSRGQQQFTDGEKSLDNSVFFGRVVQRLTHFLSTLTPGGQLYETDTRLRPNGKGGVLVSSVAAFADYQQREAWVWEHQALTRARVVVGQDSLREAFAELRHGVLVQAAARHDLREQVREMRDRMRRELSRSKDAQFDIKQDRGGIADIEFMVQYAVLANAASSPRLATATDNIHLLELSAQAGVMSESDTQALSAAYLHLREITHRRALQGEKALIELDEATVEHRNNVMGCWQRIMVEGAD
ncbi:MAG: bifunctional [glutamate--ammonia ligase]-adenylyl-L-tyrosine phosphorylase/[glutamate--ammonia-ligase] adenylyltransferase, partial [Granulosicoccaceae bacterium]